MKIEEIVVDGYERVARASDSDSGLLAFIAVHNTSLGPAVGGIRMWNYENEAAAITDVLRLSEGMSYKSAVARTGLGGGKSVIIGDSRKDKSEKLFEAMGRFVNEFQGTYYPAEDVGTSVQCLEWVNRSTQWVTGLSREQGGSGDPSPYTALGVFKGLLACVKHRFGSDDLKGKRIAVQGLGSVGGRLAHHCAEAGAHLIVTDIRPDHAASMAKELGGEAVPPDDIYDVDCDVFAPCALGAIVNENTIPRLKCSIIAGASNNQLATEEDDQRLMAREIIYAPDFVLNAGGIINVSCEFLPGGYDESQGLARTENIREAIAEILVTAESERITSHEAAMHLAKKALAK